LGHAALLSDRVEHMQVAQPQPPADLALPVDFAWHRNILISLETIGEFRLYRTPDRVAINARANTPQTVALSILRNMAMRTRELLLGSLAVAATLGFAVGAIAQVYPSRPITIIVPFPAGGSSDVLTRIVAERMRVSLGQPVIIDNVGGAAGRTGTS